MRQNYKETKNHLHNTLGISKEFVQEIIKETVKSEIDKLFADDYLQRIIDKSVKKEISKAYSDGWGNNFKDNIRGIIGKEVGKLVASRLNVNVEIADEPQEVNLMSFTRSGTMITYEGK